MANLLLPLVKGSRVVYLETLNTTELLRALSERKITAFAVVPQFFYLIHERIYPRDRETRRRSRRKLFRDACAESHSAQGWNQRRPPLLSAKCTRRSGPKMRYLVTGGSRFDPQIARDFHDLGIDVLQAYGLTETTARSIANSPNDNVIGSVGKALEGRRGQDHRSTAARRRPAGRRSRPARRGCDERLLESSGRHGRRAPRWLVSHRRSRATSIRTAICFSPAARKKSSF